MNAAGREETPKSAGITLRGFPGWRAWRSDAGRWWATRVGTNRRRPQTARAEWAMTVDADNTMELRSVLVRQEDMADPGG